jgi:hypothetical protein
MRAWNGCVTYPFHSSEFKLKSGINRVLPPGYPPIYAVLSLSSLPLRAEE